MRPCAVPFFVARSWRGTLPGCLALLLGCAASNVPTSVKAPGPTDPSIIIIGTALHDSLQFGRGSVDAQGAWLPDALGGPLLQEPPATEIYQVRSLPPADEQHPYGLYSVGGPGSALHIKCGSNTLVFSLPPGHVYYLTDVTYSVTTAEPAGPHTPATYSAQIHAHADIDRARAYIEQVYPGLRGRIEPGHIQMRAVGLGSPGLGNCVR